ncbi:MAG: glycosyltransferase [bacterium]|nr:glycosyltransferase [bacterium]
MSTKQPSAKPSICLVYDRVTTRYGGAEYLLQQLLQIFPDSPLYTIFYNPNAATWVEKKRVRAVITMPGAFTDILQKLSTPILPLAFESLDLSSYDIVISVSSAEAKGVLTRPNQLHINYLFSSPKYLSKSSEKYLRSHAVFKIPGTFWLARFLFKYLSWWDQAAAARPDYIIPLSKMIYSQLTGSYARNLLEPIYPPVEIPTQLIPHKLTKKPFFLSLSRLVWYKRVDLAIAAAVKTNSVLVVAGTGTMQSQLHKQAAKHGYIRKKKQSIATALTEAENERKLLIFLNAVTDQEKASLLASAQATIQMGKEDFGIVAVESLAHGTPVILYSKSGAAEVVRNGRDGLVLPTQSIQALAVAISKIRQVQFSRSDLREQAVKVSAKQFQKAIQTIVYDVWKSHTRGVKTYAT